MEDWQTSIGPGTPLVYVTFIGFLGIVVWHLMPRRRATASLLTQIAFFVAMSGLLIAAGIAPYEPIPASLPAWEQFLVGVAKTLWWVHLAWALIGFVRIYLVLEHKPREARLLQDLVGGVVYVAATLSIFAFVFALPVGTLIATSGALAIVLGLALQNTLSDVFSGIALNLGRPYTLGDWIVLSDGTEGRVVETDWRSTHLITLAHNVVALPNTLLAKVGIANVSKPDRSHGQSLTIRLAPTIPPTMIAAVVQGALRSCKEILQNPLPAAIVKSLDANAVEIELSYRVAGIERRVAASNAIFDLVHRHALFAGLQLAFPPAATASLTQPSLSLPDLLRLLPQFLHLDAGELEDMASSIITLNYRDGDLIAEDSETLLKLMIVKTGLVVFRSGNEDAEASELGRCAVGDMFGAAGLSTHSRQAKMLRAIGDTSVFALDEVYLATLLTRRPGLSQELAHLLADHFIPHVADDGATQRDTHAGSTVLGAIRRSIAGIRSTALATPAEQKDRTS